VRQLSKLALIVVLGGAFAVAQSMPQSSAPQSTSPSSTSPSSTQSQPASPDQQQPSTAPDQGKNPAPEQLPSTDQKKSDQSTDQNKMPQSDAAPAAATGDVSSTIQSAIQKDPSLASANVTVDVKNGKAVELNGTVPTKDAKDAAERIAKENSGGLKVKNHLKVASNASDKASDKAKPDMSNPKQ
jgi:hypothetical protein